MQAPQTYQQWLECFQQLEQNPWNTELLELIPQGSYAAKPTDAFLVRISDTVSHLLSKCTRRFLRNFDQALADGEPDMAAVLSIRMRKHIRRCLFYRDMAFLEPDFVHTLDEGFENQLNAFWKDFLRQIDAAVRESQDSQLEDMVFELKRIKITQWRTETDT